MFLYFYRQQAFVLFLRSHIFYLTQITAPRQHRPYLASVRRDERMLLTAYPEFLPNRKVIRTLNLSMHHSAGNPYEQTVAGII